MTTTTLSATPAKLRNGTWGARVSGQARQGDSIQITTRSGKSWTASVSRVLWSGEGVTLVATASAGGSRRQLSSQTCEECGERRATTEAEDSSGIVGAVCYRCADLPSWDRSFD